MTIKQIQEDKYSSLNESLSDIPYADIESKKVTDRELIKDKILATSGEYKTIIRSLGIGEDISDIEKVNKLIEYILEDIYFNRDERKDEFNELLKEENLTAEEISSFLEKGSDQKISGDDWKKLIHESGITDWSTGKLGNNIKDRIDFVSHMSYYSLQATLRTGIHTGLFLQNIGKLFPHLKDDLFSEFNDNPHLAGGLALTETSSGSDLLTDLNTTYIENEDGSFTIEGEKHLQGLTNEASHWIILAKNKRKYRLFLVDTRDPEQDVKMTEEYNMEGLKSITYGINKFSVTVPNKNISGTFEKDATGLKTFVSMLYDSRLQFPAMMVGAMERLYDESIYQASLIKISGGKMINNQIVKNQLNEIKIKHSIVDMINKYLIFKEINLFVDNTSKEDLSIISKTISTEYILSSGEVAKKLQGGFGFKENNIISNIIKDAWPFSRFEGVNEMLYSQLVPIIENKIAQNRFNQSEYTVLNLDNISKLEIDDSIKGQIYSRISLIGMISEMQMENEYLEELKFLKKEINKLMIDADNFDDIKESERTEPGDDYFRVISKKEKE